jgi:hypothetical protein
MGNHFHLLLRSDIQELGARLQGKRTVLNALPTVVV